MIASLDVSDSVLVHWLITPTLSSQLQGDDGCSISRSKPLAPRKSAASGLRVAIFHWSAVGNVSVRFSFWDSV